MGVQRVANPVVQGGEMKGNPEMGETAIQPVPAKTLIYPYPGYISCLHSVVSHDAQLH